jgi:hypothetical protein
MGATARERPHNLSITKAHAGSRIFEVKQIEYTLFGGTLLLAGATVPTCVVSEGCHYLNSDFTISLLIAPFPSTIPVCVRLNR